MNARRSDGKESPAIRADLAARLRARVPAIQAAIFDGVKDVSEPVADRDPTYAVGLQKAISGALDFSLETIERGPEWPPDVPELVLSQARRAAREGLRLDTVMRRYSAGTKVLEDFIVEAATNVPTTILRQILSEQGDQAERVMDAVSAAFRGEVSRAHRSAAKKRGDRVIQLLASETRVPPSDLDYDFAFWHVGVIVSGRGAASAGRLLAERLGFRSLQVERDSELAWTWLGSSRQPSITNIVHSAHKQLQAPTCLAVGEPRRGLEGWRLSHREAEAALRVMSRRPEKVVRGRDVVLLAAVLRDETLVRSLLDTYLVPIEELGNRAEASLDTLRAFFSCGWNAAAASEELDVDRHTIRQRIKRIEEILDQPLHTCSAELQVALQIADLRSGS